jgi:hypothetical protein
MNKIRHACVTVLLAFFYSSVGSASIINGSFESETHGLMANGVSTSLHEEWGLPDAWRWRQYGATNGHGIRADYAPFGNQIGWSSDGNWSLYVFASSADDHSPGQYIEFYQAVDLTGQSILMFDTMLRGGAFTNAYLAIDSQKLWSENQPGTYIDNTIDISAFSGVHDIQIGVEVFREFGDVADGWTYFDNIRSVPEPGTLSLLALFLYGLALTRQMRRNVAPPILNQ